MPKIPPVTANDLDIATFISELDAAYSSCKSQLGALVDWLNLIKSDIDNQQKTSN